MTNQSDREVAKIIVEQLGGVSRLSAMLGVKHLVYGTTSVLIRWSAKGRNGENAVRIELNGRDTYDVTFLKMRGTNFKAVSEFADVYADQLQSLFRDATGLAVRI